MKKTKKNEMVISKMEYVATVGVYDRNVEREFVPAKCRILRTFLRENLFSN